MAIGKYRNLKILVVTFLFLIISILTVSHEAYPRNWDWDQNHDCVQGIPGKSGWCKWGYDGNPADCNASSIECCELLCKICPVYANSGKYQKTFTDLIVPGVGPTLAITRTYNSQEWSSSLLGYSWTFNFGRKLIITRNMHGEKIIGVLLETGEKNYYKENLDGALTRLTNYGATYELVKNGDNTYTIVNRDGTRYELRQDGKIDKIIDKNNNELVFTYNTVGCLSRITNASGNHVDFQLGPNGKIASVSDNLGRTISYTYDQNGNLISATDPLGNTTQYVYNSDNFLTQIIDARGNVVETAGYDNHEPPRVSTFTEKGETYTIAYFDGRSEKTDSQGNKWTYYFNDVGVIEKVVDPLGNQTNRQLNKVTAQSVDWEDDLNGNRTSYTYNGDGNIASKTDPLDNTWTYTYIAGTNWVETETNFLGVVTKYEYDVNGNLLRLIRDFGGPLVNTTTYTYDSQGRRTSMTDPLSNTITYEYNAEGYLTKVTNQLGNETFYNYDARGNRLTETDANGNTITYAYDLSNRLVSITDPLGNTMQYNYDANGNLASVVMPNGEQTTFTFDAYNRLTQVTNPLGNTKTYIYNHNDKLLSKTDPNGNTTQYGYDALGRRTSMANAEDHTTDFGYDANGNRISVTNANGNTTTFSYDALNRLVQKTYPDGTSYTYTYNALGRKTAQTDPNGNTINYSYDRLNRQVQKTYPDTSTANFTYDLACRMLSGSNPDSNLSYTYDALGRATQVTQNGKQIQYSYDAVGNRVSMTTPEGETVQYHYNQGSQMTKFQLSSGKGVGYTYDALGNVVRKDYAGGTYSTRTYDNAGRLNNLSHLESDGTTIYTQQNTFDNVGNTLTKTTGEGTTTYSYDQTYQLTSTDHPVQTDETFTYGPVGNRLTSADHNDWTYNNRNELISYDAVTYTYDPNGNTVSKTDGTGTKYYTYNYENRLIRIDFMDGSYAEYKYDVNGRRIEKDVDGNVTNFLYDGNQLLAEYDSLGSLMRNYFYGADRFNPLLLKENGSVYFYLKDHLGTPKKLTDESGSIVWSGKSKSFGELTVNVEAVENNIRFPGQYYDSESEYHYNLHRYYIHCIGRYNTTDLIWYINRNLYIYAHNNPIRFIDPHGLLVLKHTLSGEITIGGGGSLVISWMNEVGNGYDFGLEICIGVSLGGKLGVDYSYKANKGTLSEGWNFDASLGASGALTFLGGITGGCSMSLPSIPEAVYWGVKCNDFWYAIDKIFSCGGGIAAGVKAGVSAGLTGCASYIW